VDGGPVMVRASSRDFVGAGGAAIP
jgi:hypothetical protein